MIQLSLLDLGCMPASKSPTQVVNETVKLAQAAERLGFSRYWLGEHHRPNAAWASPIVVASAVAAQTKKIRVGTGAILLETYLPLRVASDFKILEALYPGRIDLGVGKGAPADNAHLFSKNKSKRGRDARYETAVIDLLAYLGPGLKRSHPDFGAKAFPTEVKSPEVWLTGRSSASLNLALKLKTSYCHSLFHTESMHTSLASFRPLAKQISKEHKAKMAFALAGVCAASEVQAKHIFEKYRGVPFPPSFLGTPSQLKDLLLQLQYQFQIDQFIFCDFATQIEDRIRGYQLISKTCKLVENKRPEKLSLTL